MPPPEFGKTPSSMLDENGKFIDKFDQSKKVEAAQAARLAESGIVYDKSDAGFRGAEAGRAKYAFICPACKQHYSTQAALDAHAKIHGPAAAPTKKFCPTCGTECAVKAKFCPGCGGTLPDVAAKSAPGAKEEPSKTAPVAAWIASDKAVRAMDYSYREKQQNPNLKAGEREVWVEVDDSNDPPQEPAKPIQSDKPAISVSADGRYKTTKIVGREGGGNRPATAQAAAAAADPSLASGATAGGEGPRARKGWLRKAAAAKGGKDQLRGGWKDRWFTLTAGGLLSYYENQHAVKPKGVIMLKGAEVDFRSDVPGSPFVIWISTQGGRFFYLEARTLDEANAWIDDIGSVIKSLGNK